MKTVAAGYIRVSTPHQAKEGESLTLQHQAIEQYANAREWNLVEVYSDEGVSGAKERPELMRLLRDAEAKRFQALIIHKLSRFGRNARELLNNYHALKEAGSVGRKPYSAVKRKKGRVDYDFALSLFHLV